MSGNTENDEFFGDALETAVDESTAKRILTNFRKLQDLTAEAVVTEDALKDLKAQISKMLNDTLPALLSETGSDIWRDPESGKIVELETAVDSTLPKDREKRNERLEALKPLGIAEILGQEFNVVFTPGDKRADALREIFGLAMPEDVFDPADAQEEGAEQEFEPPALTNHQLALISDLRQSLGWTEEQMPAEEKLGVHASRLKSWLKKKIDSGEGEKVRAAGFWHGKLAKIKEPKK